MKLLLSVLFACACAGASFALSPSEDICPIGANTRGHENIEWTIYYDFHMTDAQKDLPRVLLVGDSICNGYHGEVLKRLDKKLSVSFWASSLCVTSPEYLKMLDFILSNNKFAVVHFNNGLHSAGSDKKAYAKRLAAAFQLIRQRQPQAKIVWANSTPVQNEKTDAIGTELNKIAGAVAEKLNIPTDDLNAVARATPLENRWRDGVHFTPGPNAKLADAVAACVLEQLKK